MKSAFLLLGLIALSACAIAAGAKAQEPVQYDAGVAAGPLKLLVDVEPGETWEGKFRMYGRVAGTVSVFDVTVTDLAQAPTGQKLSVERGQGVRSAADWIDVVSDIRLVGGEQRDVPVKVSVPAGAHGVYSAFIAVKLRPDEQSAQMSAVVIPTIDIEVLVGVRAQGPLELRAERVELGAAPRGGQAVNVDVVNTGVWMTEVCGDVLFYPESSGFPERLEFPLRSDGRLHEVYPGQSMTLSCTPVTSIPPGRYRVVVRLDLGERRETRSQFDLTVGGAGGSATASDDDSAELGTELVIDDPVREIRLPAGAQRSVAIRLSNTSDEPIALNVVTQDARLESDGRWTYASSEVDHPGINVDTSVDSLVVRAQSSTIVKATVSADKDGLKPATVVKGVRFTGRRDGSTSDVPTVYDTGALIVIEPVGAGTASLAVSSLELVRMVPDKNPGSAILTVSNHGEGVGEIQGAVTLKSESGDLIAEMVIGERRWERIMPGGTRKFRMRLPIVDVGTYIVAAELSQKGRPDESLAAETSFASADGIPEGLR